MFRITKIKNLKPKYLFLSKIIKPPEKSLLTLNLNFSPTQPIKVYSPNQFLVKLPHRHFFGHVITSDLVTFFSHLDNPHNNIYDNINKVQSLIIKDYDAITTTSYLYDG